MEKTSTLNVRVNPEDKKAAEEILSALGIPMSTAISMFLKKIALTGGIPFSMRLPEAPASVDASRMTVEEFKAQLEEGVRQAHAGISSDVENAFDRIQGSLIP